MSDSATTPVLDLVQADCPDCGAVCVFEIDAVETLTIECYACQHRFESSMTVAENTVEIDASTATAAKSNRLGRGFFIYAGLFLALAVGIIATPAPIDFIQSAVKHLMPSDTVLDELISDNASNPAQNRSASGSVSPATTASGSASGGAVFTVTQQAMTVNDGAQGSTLDVAVIVSNTGTVRGAPEVVIIALFDEADEVLVSWPILAPIAGAEGIAEPGESLAFTSQLFAPPENIARMTVSVH